MKKLIIVIYLAGSIGMAGCYGWLATKPDGSLDQTTIGQIGYDNYWQYWNGDSVSALHEVELEAWDYNRDNYLRFCGGLWPRGYVLVSENDMTLSTRVDLNNYLNNIETPEAAMAYVYATNCYLSNNFASYHQFVNPQPDGYLVGVIAYNFIGCGNHAHRQLEYLVTKDVQITLQKDTKLDWGENYCGD
ncbi:MAG: hypothetical protein WC570_04185 [Patescibacteria group bacterium]